MIGIVSDNAIALPNVFPTGTTLYDPTQAYNSYVLFSAPDGNTHLIDMDGNEVHRWDKFGFPPEMLNPAQTDGEKGHILVQLKNGNSPFGNIFANQEVGELDWDSHVVWRWGTQAPGGKARQNHDISRLPNGNTLLLTTIDHPVAGVSEQAIGDQRIIEVTKEGQVVWSWTVGDHIDEFGISTSGREILRQIYDDGGKGFGFLTINDMEPIGPNRWFDAGDSRFAPDNLVIDSREASFIAIIDKQTGKIVWRLGPDYGLDDAIDNPKAPGLGTVTNNALRPTLSLKTPRPVDQTSGQHDAHIIPEGLPGAGNLLVFDNEGPSGFPPTRLSAQLGSRVLEINPTTNTIVWQYTGIDSDQPIWGFYSSFISSARRLPNGNTLIDEGMNGRLFQVTPSGEIVWEYINPYYSRQQLGLDRTVSTNWVYRAQPIPYNWVPDGTPHAEVAIRPPKNSEFRVTPRT
ncbi:aryl-sulfate sulfotransferase [Alkalinema sp. FACHB-956]|uniref:aryl-sulfate sulfotransferase n=1 Tax=Alkalinema sp. FACHB-956 TaxID=2692768 RepID=UPI00168A1616|nr:aryl-sulfate sulfotransferase [Alkalinema sp. FACHB-956]MBD2330055.1 aryl-sulfate sulfotransferase [Alkalinema sp. FACHB-956]